MNKKLSSFLRSQTWTLCKISDARDYLSNLNIKITQKCSNVEDSRTDEQGKTNSSVHCFKI